MTYDNWKATNPDDEWLGPEPDDQEDCPNCGGEGYIYDCFDGFCEDAEYGCDDCMRRCDWCQPRKRIPPQDAEHKGARS